MLNLSIAMLRSIPLLLLILQVPAVSITSPQSGATLRGPVAIEGTMDVPNFASAELSFTYSASPAEPWFLIRAFPQPKVDSALATWDTASITDGDYNLRMRVYLQDGSVQEAVVTGLKIRNDSAEPTLTQGEFVQPTAETVVATAVPPAAASEYPQPTSLPSNPAALTVSVVYSTLGRGALIALVLFVLISLFLRLRKT